MKKYPGIVSRIGVDGTWIRPHRGGIVKGPVVEEVSVGDRVEYTTSGNGLSVIDIYQPQGGHPLNPRPLNEEVWSHADWSFDDELWTVPIWEFDGCFI